MEGLEINDRLSALPDSLIHEILSLLKMRDVVKTSLLSKHWQYLWTTVPCLKFSVLYNSVQNRNFVNRALSHWRGTQLRKISIKFSESKLQLYCPPQCLYECCSITKLKLRCCDLQIGGSVQWDHLNSLKLTRCCFSEDVINQVFSSSPRLEIFESYFNRGFHDLSIRSSSLKKLICTSDEDDLLRIWAPKVEELKISGLAFRKFLLTDVSSLTEVDLDFWNEDVGNALCQILPVIKHVTTVRLSESCVKMLGELKGEYSFPPFLNVGVLRIDSGVTELSELLHLFEVFPKVKMLVIEWAFENFPVAEQFNAKNYIMSDASILESNLLQLKTVEINLCSRRVSLLQFLEFLLKYAPVIEKIVIQTREYRERVESKDVFRVARQVLSLQRSFPSVELMIL